MQDCTFALGTSEILKKHRQALTSEPLQEITEFTQVHWLILIDKLAKLIKQQLYD